MAKVKKFEFLPTGNEREYKLSWVFEPPFAGAFEFFDKYEIDWYASKTKKYENGKVSFCNWYAYSQTTYSPYLHSEIYNPDTTTTVPEGAYCVYCIVTPLAENNQDASKRRWYGQKEQTPFYTVMDAYNPESAPSTPTLTIENKNQLAAKVTNYDDEKAVSVLFEIERTVNGKVSTYQRIVSLSNASAVYAENNAPLGASYRARAKGLNSTRGSQKFKGINGFTETVVYGESEWSDWSDASVCAPVAPSSITKIYAITDDDDKGGIHVEWGKVATATEGYKLQWTTNKSYFDASSEVSEATTEDASKTSYNVTGLDSGKTYFVRVCAVNAQGESAWTAIKSVVVGSTPDAPTTWSSTTIAYVGEEVKLYITHNSTDGSAMTVANLEFFLDGATKATSTATIKGSGTSSDDETTYVYTLKTSGYKEGAVVAWRAQTAGITSKTGPWSAKREIKIYAQPTATLTLTDGKGSTSKVEGYPLTVEVDAAPNSQTAIGYQLAVVAQASYDAMNNSGSNIHVAKGETIFEQWYDVSGNDFTLALTPSDLDLEPNIEYSLTATVTMDSGLSASATKYFTPSWAEADFTVDAHYDYNPDDALCYISPYCYEYTYTGEGDDLGTFTDVTGVTLAVYRRNADGTLTLIAEGLDSADNVAVCDLHPTLDYLRYRIVGQVESTGEVVYDDLDSYPVGDVNCIIQWDEEWSSYNVDEDADSLAEKPASSSMLKLPYNQDLSYSTQVECSTVNYIGRTHPVSYYGTQESTSVTWKVDIVRDDVETIYQLRRLQAYHGDVYVRDPTGFGCWANVVIDFERTYDSGAIPVTITITRVDGGA